MNNFPKKEGSDQDLRTFIKSQHKKFYSVCRLFASNYKEHQRLFFDLVAAVSFSIRNNRSEHEKQTLLLRACVNMSALHSISLGLEPAMDRSIQFKSPDYQRNMSRFHDSMGSASDYDKILLFLGFEKVQADAISDLTGAVPAKRAAQQAAMQGNGKKNFIPYLKEKLIWS